VAAEWDIPTKDPLGKHCFDVSVNLDDQKATEWLSGGTKDVLSIANSQDEAIQVLRQQPGLSKCV